MVSLTTNQIQIIILIVAITAVLYLTWRVVSALTDDNNRVFVFFIVLFVLVIAAGLISIPFIERCSQQWCIEAQFYIPK